MDAFEISHLIARQQQSGLAYLEFLRVPSLSMGIYALPPGGVDPQKPHTEDEVYYVVEGRGMIQVGDEDRPVAPGTLIFVKAGVKHHFHTITKELRALVFFAPAEFPGPQQKMRHPTQHPPRSA